MEELLAARSVEQTVYLHPVEDTRTLRLAEGVQTLAMQLREDRCYAVIGISDDPDASASATLQTDEHLHTSEEAPGRLAASLVLGMREPICPGITETFDLQVTAQTPTELQLRLYEQRDQPLAVDEGLSQFGGPGTDPAAGPQMLRVGQLGLAQLIVATGVENRRPVGARTEFSRTEHRRIYCYLRVDNPEREATSVFVSFEPVERPSTEQGREQQVGPYPQYVTFTYTGTRRPAGRYRCVVRTAGHQLLGQVAFDIID